METQASKNIPVTSEHKSHSMSKLRSFNDMEIMFDRMYDRFLNWAGQSNLIAPRMHFLDDVLMRTPLIDVIDKDAEITVRAEVPGLDKKDIDVSVQDNTLTIKGQSSCEKSEDKGDYHRQEICTSSFDRTVVLPVAVSTQHAVAKLKDGILEVSLQKLEPTRRHNISVN